MSEYKASKTQLRKLDELNIEHSQYMTYREAGQLLQAAGWTFDGRTQEVHDENYAGYYSNYSEYR